MNITKKHAALIGITLVLIGLILYRLWLAYAAIYPIDLIITDVQGDVTINGKQVSGRNIIFDANNALISVAEGAILNTRLSDDSIFQIFENSEVRIQKAKRNIDSTRYQIEFKLDKGEIIRNIPTVRKNTTDYSSSLFTDEVNIGVRGTRYAAISKGGLTKTMVYSGKVSLKAPGYNETGLQHGFGTLTYKGKSPEEPSKLPPPPVPDKSHEALSVLTANLDVQWSPVKEAERYLIEVAEDPDFNVIVFRRYSDKSSFTIEKLPYDANFRWRISSIDRRGLRGDGSISSPLLYKYHHELIKTTADKSIDHVLIERATREFGSDVQLLRDVAAYLSARGGLEEALEYYNRILSLKGPSPEDLLTRGTILRHLGRHGEAEKDFNEVLEMPADDSDAFYGLGLVELDRDNAEKAIEYFYRVIALNPAHKEVHLNAANAWRQLGKLDKARRHLKLHAENFPDDPRIEMQQSLLIE